MLAITTHTKHIKFSKPFCSQSDASLMQRLRELQKQRLSDPEEELDRLKSNPSVRTRLNNVLSIYEREAVLGGLYPSPLHHVSFCRSIELQKAVEDTHIVLNHGQSGSSLLSLNILNRELQNTESLEFEVKLRHPANFSEQTHTVDFFKNTLCFRDLRISDHHFKNDLIACDGYLGSTAQAESAWSFFLSGCNRDHETKWKVVNQIAEKLLADSEKRKSFLQKFSQIDEEIIRNSYSRRGSHFYERSGNLYSILIPKTDFDSVGYLARPCGVPAELRETTEIHLDKLQKDETAGEFDPIQVRLLAQKVCSLNLKTFVFPTRLDQELKEHILQIRSLVKEYFE